MKFSKLKVKRFFFKTKLYKLNSLFNRFHIIPYHMVVDKPNGFYPEISIHDFERQVAQLYKNYNVISLDEIVERVTRRESLRRCVAITFDDGFRDNYEKAYPILKQYGVPATIFLTTGYIEGEKSPWFIKLRHIFMKTRRTHFQFRMWNQAFSIPMRSSLERYEASEVVMKYLMNSTDVEKYLVLERLSEELEANESMELSNIMLNWEQIREMSKNGIDFGAHTVNHPVLTRVPISEAEEEIVKSKDTIEYKLGKPVTSFAYPFGNRTQYSVEFFEILEKYKFNCAVTAERGSNGYGTELFALNRGAPWELSMLT